MRKTIAHLTGFHGFFSGTVHSPGVQVAVVGEGHGSPPSEEDTWVSKLKGRWWWQGEADRSGNSVTLAESETGEGESVGDPGDRYWIGFRWYPGGQRSELEPEEGGGSGQARGFVASDSAAVGEEVQQDRWQQMWNVLGFGRKPSSAEVGEVLYDDSPETEENEEEHEADERRVGSQLSYFYDRVQRPWLSVGWTPWGSSRKIGYDVPIVEAPVEEVGLVDDGLVTGNGGSSGSAGVVGIKEEEVVPKLKDEPSYLKRWWPVSSSWMREEEDKVAVVHDEPEGQDRVGGVQAGGVMEGGSEDEFSPKEEKEWSLLRRWWPVAKEPTMLPVSVPTENGEAELLNRDEKEREEEKNSAKDEEEQRGEVLAPLSLQLEGAINTKTPTSEAAGVEQEGDLEPAPVPTNSPIASRLWPVFRGPASPERASTPPGVEEETTAAEEEFEVLLIEQFNPHEGWFFGGKTLQAEGFVRPGDERGSVGGSVEEDREENVIPEEDGRSSKWEQEDAPLQPHMNLGLHFRSSDGVTNGVPNSESEIDREYLVVNGLVAGDVGKGVHQGVNKKGADTYTTSVSECAMVDSTAVEIDASKERSGDGESCADASCSDEEGSGLAEEKAKADKGYPSRSKNR